MTTQQTVLSICLSFALATATGAVETKSKGGGKAALAPGQSRTYDMGPNVKPRYIRESVRPDGKSSIVYGNKLQPNGRIAKPHGHTVSKPSEVAEYARTPGGSVVRGKR